jgi:hypothetical protein
VLRLFGLPHWSPIVAKSLESIASPFGVRLIVEEGGARIAFKCPVPGCEDSEKEFQTEVVVLKSSAAYWFSHIFRLTFYNEEARVLCYDKQQLAYICRSDRAVAGHVNLSATFPDFSYRDEEKVTFR